MKYAYIAISLLLIAYVVACAGIVPFTVDEAWTYDEFVKGNSVWDVMRFAHPVANNHILNTLLTKPFALISPYEVSLRMPNILSFILYLYSAYKIARLLVQNKWMQLAFFISFVCNTSLIHFFALCRGYGLSIGLMLFSIYQLLLVTQNGWKKYNVHACFISAILAVYASFTLLYVYVPIACWVGYIYFRHNEGRSIKDYLRSISLPAIYSLVLALLCYTPISKLSRQNELYYGGDSDFINDTLFTLMQDLVGASFISHHKRLVLGLLIIPLLVSFGIAIYKCTSKRNLLYTAGPYILFCCITFINLHFYLSGSKLVISRTALFLSPLIILCLFSAIAKLQDARSSMVNITTWGIALVLSVFFIIQVNFSTTRDWWFDAHNKKVLSYITTHMPDAKRKTRLYAYYLCANSFNYYISTRKYNIEEVSRATGLSETELLSYDFLFLMNGTYTVHSAFRLISTYNEGNFLLYQKIR